MRISLSYNALRIYFSWNAVSSLDNSCCLTSWYNACSSVMSVVSKSSLYIFKNYAQSINFLPVTKLDSRNGFSWPKVRKIFQDKYKFMWFATINGLIRFDGINYTVFNVGNKRETQSLLGTEVSAIENGNGD